MVFGPFLAFGVLAFGVVPGREAAGIAAAGPRTGHPTRCPLVAVVRARLLSPAAYSCVFVRYSVGSTHPPGNWFLGNAPQSRFWNSSYGPWNARSADAGRCGMAWQLHPPGLRDNETELPLLLALTSSESARCRGHPVAGLPVASLAPLDHPFGRGTRPATRLRAPNEARGRRLRSLATGTGCIPQRMLPHRLPQVVHLYVQVRRRALDAYVTQ